MASWKSFEEIGAWQLAREYNKSLHHLIENSDIKSNFKLKDQMYSSGGSIMDNIAEGFGRGNNNEFIVFLSYAKGSANEARSQLYRALDFDYIDYTDFEKHTTMTRRISGRIQRLITYLKKSDIRGTRYK